MAIKFIPTVVKKIQRTFKFLPSTINSTNGWFYQGRGYLAGSLPEYFARYEDGSPATMVKVELWLSGRRVKSTFTDNNGFWSFSDLNPNGLYDIVARHETLEAVISTKRKPISLGMEVVKNDLPQRTGSTFSQKFIVFKGEAPYEVFVGALPVTYTVDDKNGIITLSATMNGTPQSFLVRISCRKRPTLYKDVTFSVPAS